MYHRLLRIATLSLLATPMFEVSAQFSGSIAPPSELIVGFDAITDKHAEDWLSILAGPGFEGRGTGQVGYTKAAHWVAGKAAEFGLEPMGDGGTYFQMLPMSRLSVEPTQSKMTGPKDLSIVFDKAIGLERFTNLPEVRGGVAFVCLSGESPKIDESVSLRDKIVFYTADEKAQGRAQGLIARQRPVATFRIVNEEPKSGSQLQREGGRQRAASLSGTISTTAAAKIVSVFGGDASWTTLVDGDAKIFVAEGELKLELRYREEPAAVPNVLAWQPGSDPD